MFDAEEEMAIASGEMMAPRTLTEDELRGPVSKLCSRRAETVASEATIADAVHAMKSGKIGSLAIVDAEGLLVGIVTERDMLMKVLLEELDPNATPVSAVMTPNPETLLPSDSMVFAMNKMHIGGFRHVPIVDEAGRPLYVVSIRDVVRFVLDVFEPTIANVPPDAFPHLRRFA